MGEFWGGQIETSVYICKWEKKNYRLEEQKFLHINFIFFSQKLAVFAVVEYQKLALLQA